MEYVYPDLLGCISEGQPDGRIPKWMDDKVVQSGLGLSRVLQDALNEKLA
jgi:hypothetical protein